jgi:MSHA biogenesis protein MshO
MTRHFPLARRAAGVTLVELVIVIVLVAILSVIAVQLGNPIKGYIEASHRATLADAADTALRRIGRDVHLALPNSVRVDLTGKYLEFGLVRTGGRYRVDVDPAATATCGGGAAPAEDVLSIGASDSCFKTIGDVANIGQVAIGDYLVVFNLAPGTPNADFYTTGANKSTIDALPTDSAGSERITFNAFSFTHDSPGRRFFIVEGPVTYACESGVLRRYWGYTIVSPPLAQPTSFPVGTSSAILVSGVTDCNFTYSSAVTSQGAGLVTMYIKVTAQISGASSESVNLYHAVHVNNVP